MENKTAIAMVIVDAVVACGKKGSQVFMTEEGIKLFQELVKSEVSASDLQRYVKIAENVG